MRLEHLRGWLAKRPTGAKRISLVVDTKTGVEPVAEWELDDIEAMGDPPNDPASTILASAQEFTNAEEEKQKFLIRWMGTGKRVIKTTSHHMSPSAPEASGLAPMELDATAIIERLLSTNLQQLERVDGAMETIISGSTRIIEMQNKQLEIAYKLVAQAREDIPEVTATVVEQTDEQVEEGRQRTLALEKLNQLVGEVAPDAGKLLVRALAKKFAPEMLAPEETGKVVDIGKAAAAAAAATVTKPKKKKTGKAKP